MNKNKKTALKKAEIKTETTLEKVEIETEKVVFDPKKIKTDEFEIPSTIAVSAVNIDSFLKTAFADDNSRGAFLAAFSYQISEAEIWLTNVAIQIATIREKHNAEIQAAALARDYQTIVLATAAAESATLDGLTPELTTALLNSVSVSYAPPPRSRQGQGSGGPRHENDKSPGFRVVAFYGANGEKLTGQLASYVGTKTVAKVTVKDRHNNKKDLTREELKSLTWEGRQYRRMNSTKIDEVEDTFVFNFVSSFGEKNNAYLAGVISNVNGATVGAELGSFRGLARKIIGWFGTTRMSEL